MSAGQFAGKRPCAADACAALGRAALSLAATAGHNRIQSIPQTIRDATALLQASLIFLGGQAPIVARIARAKFCEPLVTRGVSDSQVTLLLHVHGLEARHGCGTVVFASFLPTRLFPVALSWPTDAGASAGCCFWSPVSSWPCSDRSIGVAGRAAAAGGGIGRRRLRRCDKDG